MIPEKEFEVLERYIQAIAQRMGLRDWEIVVRNEAATRGKAQCQAIVGRKVAIIRVGHDFMDWSADDQRHAVVHELVHPHFENAWNVVELDLDESRALSQQAFDLMYKTFTRQMEYGVDGIAAVIAPHMPHIEWSDTPEIST